MVSLFFTLILVRVGVTTILMAAAAKLLRAEAGAAVFEVGSGRYAFPCATGS